MLRSAFGRLSRCWWALQESMLRGEALRQSQRDGSALSAAAETGSAQRTPATRKLVALNR